MSNYADINCTIKFINLATGKILPDGATVIAKTVGLRYSVSNDGTSDASGMFLTCSLKKDGKKLANPFFEYPFSLSAGSTRAFNRTLEAPPVPSSQIFSEVEYRAGMLVGFIKTEDGITGEVAPTRTIRLYRIRQK
ncbi:MAG: hypothetical protein KF791_11960 [Verrucomicrobiae bacterium]|nr:hypothetical protein [Verrucomicrobiae bacterium]